ncbi:hydrogenase expression/formation protein HypE [Methanorbis furvi]|uniref:Carbamoyl dehydratase HypE n=1 Tax=Methanorbis furvi TaxID=3028299 RepID=A0AAE4MBM6_9EURY|nr:Carbamoyl dehydratase HypE [Methanocorpusculaceae archaeon Ag1]
MKKDTEVNMMHGAGGEVMGELLQTLTAFKHNNAGGIGLESLDDGSTFDIGGKTVVLTTDSHVVKPIFFPGGDIGRVAVSGTINDLSVMGARPVALTCAMVIEEGFPIADLEKIVASMDEALGECGASIITGDTKVVEKGSLDGIVINTAGVGVVDADSYLIRDRALAIGDKIIVSGTLGDHGMAIVAYREGFDLGDQLKSDVAPLYAMIHGAVTAAPKGAVHAMKDPTRGGFAACINEMARKAGVKVVVEQDAMPVRESVASAGSLLGIDPLQVANEGKCVMGVSADAADAVLAALKKHPYGKNAVIVGEVVEGSGVVMRTRIGGERFIEPPMGDPVPRVC